MTRYAITFDLATPLVWMQRDQRWTLDHWLAGAAAAERWGWKATLRQPGDPDWISWRDLHIPLAWEPFATVYATTQASFPLGGLLTSHYRTKKPVLDVLYETGQVGSGVLKASHFRIWHWEIPRVAFIADVTDPDRLDTLLDILLTQGVGADRHRGYGAIVDIAVTPVPAETASAVWDAQGYPTRPVPWPAADTPACTRGLADGTLRLALQRLDLPAWLTRHQTLCIMPTAGWPDPHDLPQPAAKRRTAGTAKDAAPIETKEAR